MGSAILQICCCVLTYRGIYVRFNPVEPEVGGRDANDRVTLLVKNNRGAESIRSCTEVALPETVAQNHGGRPAGKVLFRQECAAVREVYAQNGKEAERDA